MSLDLRPASLLPLGELAGLFNACYADYFVPFEVDEGSLGSMARTLDIDPDASFVAVEGGQHVGFVNLGVRAERGWIGGLGVIPSARRKGVGRALMEAVHDSARACGIRQITLEVIEANEPAFRLYDELGYAFLRWVEIGSLEQAGSGSLDDVPWEEAHARIRELRTWPEPWQRADETLRHHDDLHGALAGGGAAVYRVLGTGGALLMQFAGDEEAARETLAGLRAAGPVTILNVPEGDPLVAAFAALGGSVSLRQRELALRLPNEDRPTLT